MNKQLNKAMIEKLKCYKPETKLDIISSSLAKEFVPQETQG